MMRLPCNNSYKKERNRKLPSRDSQEWNLLVYKIPSQPSRLRLQIWRKLQRMGAVYLQDAACLLPARADLDENMQYLATSIEEMGGTCHLFQGKSSLPGGDARLIQDFQNLADERIVEILERLDELQLRLQGPVDQAVLERAEEDLKRERIAYLRVRSLAYFGSRQHPEVDARLHRLKNSLDELYKNWGTP